MLTINKRNTNKKAGDEMMVLTMAKAGQIHSIKTVKGNPKTRDFLFSLGCNEGEEITLISILAGNYIINVKDSRYAIDKKMAEAIELA